MYRLKLKCPICWAETYILVSQSDNEDRLVQRAWDGHKEGTSCEAQDPPKRLRRDPV